MQRRKFLAAGIGGFAAALVSPRGLAQSAGGTTRIIFPFAPGGPGDGLSRLLADAIATATGRPAIVEDRTGADGRIGIQVVKNSAPTGETLLVTTGPSMWLMPMVHPAPGFDPVQDFTPISLLTRSEFCVAVANNTGVKTMADFRAWLAANPQKASYGIPGLGTIPHFTGTRLAKLLGVDMVRVVYRGTTPAMNDLISGQIPIAVVTVGDAVQQYRAGNVHVLAVTSQARSPFLPDVPTMRESGIDLVGDAWYALWGPAGTPSDVVAKLNAAAVALMAKPDTKDRLAAFGLVAVGSTPQQLAQAMSEAATAWGPIVKETGYKIEQ